MSGKQTHHPKAIMKMKKEGEKNEKMTGLQYS